MSNETKLACGCYAEWTGERWQISASSFLCDHDQGDPVDGAPPMSGQPDLLNVEKHHAPGVVHQYLVDTVAALAEAQKEAEFYEIECSALRQEVDDAQDDAKAARAEIAQLETAYDRACGYCTCGSLDKAEDALAQLRGAAQYALDAITSPDIEFAPGKDIYDTKMMLGAARRLRSALGVQIRLEETQS